MTDFLHPENGFLRSIIGIIEQNLDDEHFGVPQLAEAASMSRSNLLRKTKKLTGDSVSVFIRKVRLHNAKKLLADDSLTASEVAYRVGFKSPSYFTKCYREEFGTTPGERLLHEEALEPAETPRKGSPQPWKVAIPVVFAAVVIGLLAYLLFAGKESSGPTPEEPVARSIAVLPFTNDSEDTTNVYFINGLMQTILTNLQHIKDLDVKSRTTVEKYRTSNKSIPELAAELGVNYFVEGSGQKVGEQILLSVQLIDARTDSHIWSQQYNKEVKDIFSLQAEVAQSIATAVEAVITPAEQQSIEKQPTENLEAYDLYLKGLDLANVGTTDGLHEAIDYFNQAIEEDPRFANAYAYVAICYYYLDIFQAQKHYTEEINEYAENANLYDSELTESLVAKGMYFMQIDDYERAVQYFEKALSYSPNSGWIHNFLSDIYTSYLLDIEKYLVHTIQGIQTAVADKDSISASISYLHLSNALVQTGFIREADKYIRQAVAYDPDNLSVAYFNVYLRQALNLNLARAKTELLDILEKSPYRVDILQEAGKICFMMEDYEEAWKYYDRFITQKETYNLGVFPAEDLKIGFVLEKLGRREEAQKYYDSYKAYVDSESSIYHELMLSAYYATRGDTRQGMIHLKEFAKEDDFIYWVVLFLDKDPMLKLMSDHPDYQATMNRISDNFWQRHEKRKQKLEAEGFELSNM